MYIKLYMNSSELLDTINHKCRRCITILNAMCQVGYSDIITKKEYNKTAVYQYK